VKKSELQQIIKEEIRQILKENLLQNQGYAGSYYGFKSDIADSWDDINDMKSDMMKYFEALNDVQGSSKVLVQKGTKGLGGSRLVHAVADELIKIANKAKSKYND